MKKVGIVTVPYYENFGSVLQAYALKTFIEKNFKVQVEILPFQPKGREHIYFKDAELQDKFSYKKQKFNEFRHESLGISAEPISEKALSELEYDIYIAGSDQIWNPNITDLHSAYFLKFAHENSMKISYAASMGIDLSLAEKNCYKFKNGLENLNYVSIRERTDLEFLQKLSEKKIEVHIDPALLLESTDYDEIIEENFIESKPYMLCYFLTHNPALVDYSNLMAKKFGLKIIHYFADYPDRVFLNDSDDFSFAGPNEFLGYIKNATLIFTNSFHGTVFSIIFEKPFYAYTAKRNMLNRILDVTSLVGLQSRCFNRFDQIGELKLEIEYDEARQRLQKEREKAKRYLEKALS